MRGVALVSMYSRRKGGWARPRRSTRARSRSAAPRSARATPTSRCGAATSRGSSRCGALCVCARARRSLHRFFLPLSLSLCMFFLPAFRFPSLSPLGGPRGEDGGEVLSTAGSVARPIPRHIAIFGPASPSRRIPSHASPLRSKAATTRPSRCSSGASRSERQEHVSRPARPAPSRPHPTAARSLARIRATRVSRETAGDRRLY